MTQSMFQLLVAPGGRGPCVAISGEQPCPALLQDLPMHWTVGISPRGVAARGEGELVPPPLSLTLQPPCFSLPAFLRGIPRHFFGHPHPTRAFVGIPMRFCRHPHPARACGKGYPYSSAGIPTPPAPAALLPRPLLGAGSVRGDIRRTAVSGFFPAYSRILDRGDIATGGWGRRGGGTRSPSPVSNTPETPHTSPTPPRLATQTPLAGTPHPARACGAPPPPPPGAEAVRGDIRRATVSGVEPGAAVPGSSPAALLIRVLRGLARVNGCR